MLPDLDSGLLLPAQSLALPFIMTRKIAQSENEGGEKEVFFFLRHLVVKFQKDFTKKDLREGRERRGEIIPRQSAKLK